MSRLLFRPHANGVSFGMTMLVATMRGIAEEMLPCRREDGELWFSALPAELEQAKAYCRECPVRLKCLVGAVERREPCGVWGGEIFDNGVIIARKRPRGRPRKHPAPAARAAGNPIPA